MFNRHQRGKWQFIFGKHMRHAILYTYYLHKPSCRNHFCLFSHPVPNHSHSLTNECIHESNGRELVCVCVSVTEWKRKIIIMMMMWMVNRMSQQCGHVWSMGKYSIPPRLEIESNLNNQCFDVRLADGIFIFSSLETIHETKRNKFNRRVAIVHTFLLYSFNRCWPEIFSVLWNPTLKSRTIIIIDEWNFERFWYGFSISSMLLLLHQNEPLKRMFGLNREGSQFFPFKIYLINTRKRRRQHIIRQFPLHRRYEWI